MVPFKWFLAGILSCSCFLFASMSEAATVSLDFRGSGGTFDFDSETGVYVDGTGVQLNFEALVGGVQVAGSDLNATAASFGVNAVGAGDATSELDTPNGIESIRITFTAPVNTNVNLNSIDIAVFGGSDAGTMTIAGGSPIALASGTNIDPSFTLMNDESLLVAVSAGSFSFQGLTFTTTEVSSPGVIPEPATAMLLMAGSLLFVGRRQRRKC